MGGVVRVARAKFDVGRISASRTDCTGTRGYWLCYKIICIISVAFLVRLIVWSLPGPNSIR